MCTILLIKNVKVIPSIVIGKDTFKAYDFKDVFDFHHYGINHSKLPADEKNNIKRNYL